MTPAASLNPPRAAGVPQPDLPRVDTAKGAVAISGLLLIVIGVTGWSWQAGFVLAGSMMFAWAFLTSKARKQESKKAA